MRRSCRGLEPTTVVAHVTGHRYNLDNVLRLFSAADSPHKVLLTFPPATGRGQDRMRRPLELIAFETASVQTPGLSVTHFLMREGSHVGWGATKDEMVALERTLSNSKNEEANDVTETRTQFMTFQSHDGYAADGGSRAVGSFVDTDTDTFVLENSDVITKVPFSYALAQSALIDAATATVEPVASSVREWSRGVISSGRLDFDIRDLRQKKAQMMLVSTDAIGGKALDKPVFFWYASTGKLRNLEETYLEAKAHLEVDRRKWFLQQRLQHMVASKGFLREEHHCEALHRLEWMIVWLLVVNALMFALQYYIDKEADEDGDD